MPHICLEYSDNLEDVVDIAALCDTLRKAGIETGVFPMPGIRVRARACRHYSIADGDPAHGFIDISIRLRGGRPMDVRKQATAQMFEAAETFLQPVLDRQPLALSMEMRDIDPELSPKTGSIRRFLDPERKAG